MLNDFTDWVERNISGYSVLIGAFIESSADHAKHVCVVQQSGGSPSTMGARFPRFRVFLLGPRNDRGASRKVYEDADSLVRACIDHLDLPCRAASVKALVEPVGPNFTKEGRAWAQIDFEIIY